MCRKRLGIVQVVTILPGPSEGLPFHPFQTLKVDVPGLEELDILFAEVFSYAADQSHLGKETGGDTEEGGRTAKRLLDLTERGFDRVISNCSNDQNWGHVFSLKKLTS